MSVAEENQQGQLPIEKEKEDEKKEEAPAKPTPPFEWRYPEESSCEIAHDK